MIRIFSSWSFFILFFFIYPAGKILHAQEPADSLSRLFTAKKVSVTEDPSLWISKSNTILNDLFIERADYDPDTATLYQQLNDYNLTLEMLRNSFYGKNSSLNIRTVHGMKMRVADILSEISKIQNRIQKESELLVSQHEAVVKIRKEIREFREQADSVYILTFDKAVGQLEMRLHHAEQIVIGQLNHKTSLEEKINGISIQVYILFRDLSRNLEVREAALVKRELPPLWASHSGVYSYHIGQVLKASFSQTLESVQYYGKMALWRIILFRGIILLLCLIPIKIFHDRQRKQKIEESARLTFLAAFPKTASVLMGMALAPVIFIHPPHAFMEIIMIGLTMTVTMLTLKTYPLISKPLLLTLIISFLILYLINFFVTPTAIGRLIYTFSVFLLIPVFLMFRQIPGYVLKHPKAVRWLMGVLSIHLVTGWILVVAGSYTLGRSFILAGFGLLISIMILRVAIFTVLDYMEIMVYFYNSRNGIIRINAEYIRRKLKPLLMLGGFLLMTMAYLYSMNLLELFWSGFKGFLAAERAIGDSRFRWISVVVFLGSVYLAFQAATLLRRSLEPNLEKEFNRRSNMGSYLLFLRLLLICAGLMVGILASGLSMTNFTIVLGALSVGIGFGLQNVVSNLVSGLIIAFERPFVVGDTLELANESGKVKEISLRATMISTSSGADILIPNNTLLSDNLKNWTISNKSQQIDIPVLTANTAHPETVMKLIRDCLDHTDFIDRDKSEVFFTRIDEKGLQFTIQLLIHDLGVELQVRSLLLTSVYKTFEQHSVPLPERENHPS